MKSAQLRQDHKIDKRKHTKTSRRQSRLVMKIAMRFNAWLRFD